MGSRGSERRVREDEIARERERKNKGIQGAMDGGGKGERERAAALGTGVPRMADVSIFVSWSVCAC